jgi:hypothetical protein
VERAGVRRWAAQWGKEREKGKRPWAELPGGKRREGEGKGKCAGWAGPKEENRDGERGKIKQLLLNLKMKFEFKRKISKISMQRA